MTNADFSSSVSVPIKLLSGKGRKEVKDALTKELKKEFYEDLYKTFNWKIKTSNNNQGTKFLDPKNSSGNNVRVQRGNPNSPNQAQQKPYVKQMENGKQIDINGKSVPSRSVESHIPLKDFKYKNK